jgi:hypothetical protein
MRSYSAGFQPDVAGKTLRVSRFVSTVPMVVIAAWLVAGGTGVASDPTTARPRSDAAQASAAAAVSPAKVAAIDEEDDGDDDQADPDDPNDTLAAADAFWWGAADVSLRTSQTERETPPRSEAFANQVVQAA